MHNKTMPVGTIIAYAGLTEPQGWLFCDGRELDIEYYRELFGLIGFTYNTAEFETPEYYELLNKFRIPNLKNSVIEGKDNSNNSNHLGLEIENKIETPNSADTSNKFIVLNYLIKAR